MVFTQDNKFDVGQFYGMLQHHADTEDMALSYLAKEWPEREQWRILGRAKMQELLAFQPESVALEPDILDSTHKDGYTRFLVRYAVTPFRSTEAYLLIPDGLTEPAPAVIALHDHSAFYYYGKEKITETENRPQALVDIIEKMYEGRPFADEVARRGFVVLCPDVFYFGSQKLDVNQIPENFTDDFSGFQSEDINEYIAAYNSFCGSHENILARYIFASGITWPGILFYDDRRAVDYLLTRPEVDADRIGCMGLSLGGFRSAHLFGLDPRLKVGVVAGWMTTYPGQINNHLSHHTWMIYVPRQLTYLDLPDVASLNAPNPLLVINCRQDGLYTVNAMQTAAYKLEAIYQKMGEPEKFRAIMYDVPHMLNIKMQNDAIDWLIKWL
ncbi:dienelactone hydrolase family protein [candidate division KSB1 bacterium]|nr:dienelactone hydrolase family protein [candidate division KSB1 bacterium]